MQIPKNRPANSNGNAICYARYSSAEQGKGDSERRQGEAAQAYCQQHGLTLLESILDEGVSGFTGENRTKGKLLGLLERIQRGMVPRGTTLIIESFDRLSRQDALKQLSLFIELMKHGIHLVTLDSGMEFTGESSANPAQLFLSLASMVRGHEESKVKSDRVSAAWQNKRRNAALRPLTSLCPLWIKLDRATGKLVLISERAKVIRLIFRLAAEGLGKRSIARELNHRRIKTFGASSWQDSYVHRILNNPAVLGILQPYRQRHGEKRQPAGDPVVGYYPAAITPAQWDEAHQKPSLPTGPRATRVTNLFTGVLIDEKTKSTLQVEIKGGKARKHYVFLRPRAAVLGLPCEDYRLEYAWFEEIFLRFLAELDWVELSQESAEDVVAGETEEKQLTSQMTELEKKLRNLSRAIESTDGKSVSSLVQRVQQYEEEHQRMSERLERFKDAAAIEKQSAAALQSAPPSDQRNDSQYRRRLQLEIRKRIKRVRVYPHADWSPVERRMHQKTPGWTTFVVHFMNGALRILTAQNDNAKSVLVHEVRGDWEPAKAILADA